MNQNEQEILKELGFSFEKGKVFKHITEKYILQKDTNKTEWSVDVILKGGNVNTVPYSRIVDEEILKLINTELEKIAKFNVVPVDPQETIIYPVEELSSEEKTRLENEENRKILEALENGDIKKTTTKQRKQETKIPAVQNKQIISQMASTYNYTETQLEAIKNTVAKGASDDEFEMLMYLANRYQLDPILKEIFYSSNLQTIMTSRDGYLKIAHRDPKFKGIQSMAVCENDEFEMDVINCKVSHKFGKGERGKVIGAWSIVKKEGLDPVVAYAPYDEHVQPGSKAWKYKSAMCCKCAESFALKRQFCITGLVTHEEFGIENIDIIEADYEEVTQ